jgi:hypothetical protein
MPKEQEQQQMSRLAIILAAADSAEPDPDRKVSLQIEEGLAAVTRAVKETSQDGTLVITLKVEPGAEARVGVSAKVKVTCPRPAVPSVTLYADEEGHLTTAQMGLFGANKSTRTPNPTEN